MKKSQRAGWQWLVLAAFALVAVAGVGSVGTAQYGPALHIGGTSANFGVFSVRGGFMPDPQSYPIVSGGNIDVSALGLAPGCRGYVTQQPDAIIHYIAPAGWVRFFVRGAGDTTLVINDASGHWFCDDDSGGSLNPMIDLRSPPGGQYDIWVGSYRAGENIRAQLSITELSSQRP